MNLDFYQNTLITLTGKILQCPSYVSSRRCLELSCLYVCKMRIGFLSTVLVELTSGSRPWLPAALSERCTPRSVSVCICDSALHKVADELGQTSLFSFPCQNFQRPFRNVLTLHLAKRSDPMHHSLQGCFPFLQLRFLICRVHHVYCLFSSVGQECRQAARLQLKLRSSDPSACGG